jgi:CubicO group peptidase (beta-lactamase class C family)
MKKNTVFACLFSLAVLILAADAAAERSVESLIREFSKEDPFAAGEAVAAIAEIGSPAVVDLIRSLADKNDNVRWCAAIALGKIAPAGSMAIPALTAALKDKNANVRWCAAIALGIFRNEALTAVPGLLERLRDADRDVRWAAHVALARIDKGKTAATPPDSEIVEKLRTMTPRLMKELKVPGVAIRVITNFAMGWTECFGASDAVRRKAVNGRTIFEACSMSKPVLACLALKLVEGGRLDLDRPLSDYLPEPFVSEDDQAALITARMILSHTSGMPNWRKGEEERGGPIPVYFKPGTKFSYSGEGIYYLQRVVEHITREALASYAKRTLFDPLGMASTSFVWTADLDPRIASGHDAAGKRLVRSRYTHANAAYTLVTTADDYAAFLIQVMKGDGGVLSARMLDEMVAEQVRADTRDAVDRPGRALGLSAHRGLGWAIDRTISGDIVYHSGSNRTGFTCYAQFNRSEGSGIVIMTNGQNGGELWSRLISEVGDL